MQPRKNSKQNASNSKKSFSPKKGDASSKPKSDFKKSSISKDKPSFSDRPFSDKKPKFSKGGKPSRGKKRPERVERDDMRLNRFLSVAGICSRREADELIAAGLVEVNGKIVTEMGYRVLPTDKVKYAGSLIRGEKKQYVLLNKPKGFITTMDDPKARKTVMELVAKACKERIYPVGRLDRATTGLLLFTNDGELAKKLTHPSHGATKIYEVVLDKNLSQKDFNAIVAGFELEDGPVQVDELSFVEGKARNHLGIKIHIGRNRIVRRIFEHFGYEVIKLDRVVFAGLTKKNLPRGHYRFLTKQELEKFHVKI
jgi:23S rRNA pseudouridine2605 synthase